MYRDNFPQREVCEFCFVLNTFTYVSSTKRDSVVGVKERSEWMVKWMAAKPAEAPGGRGLRAEPAAPRSRPPGVAGPLQSAWCLRRLLIPQDGLWFAPDPAGCVWSRSIRCWKGYIHPLFCWCLWEPHLLRCEATP